MQKRTETAVLATVRGLDLVVEKQQRLRLANPGVWEDYAYEVALAGPQGPVSRYDYPTLGVRSARFLYKVEDFAVPKTMQGGPSDAAFAAAYHRFQMMRREIDRGGKPV